MLRKMQEQTARGPVGSFSDQNKHLFLLLSGGEQGGRPQGSSSAVLIFTSEVRVRWTGQ